MRILLAALLALPAGAAPPPREDAALFLRHCARCHGADGNGRGGRGERLPGGRIPDPARLAVHGEEALVKLILDGRRGMPGFRAKLGAGQARALARQLLGGRPAGR